MKKIASTGILVAAFLFGMSSCNQEQGAVEEAQETNEQMAEDTEMEDQMTHMSDFMTKAASGGMMEVELGKLAQQKGQMKEVKDFGSMMVKDHEQVNQELRSHASRLNITLPDSMGQDHMDHVKELRNKTGAEFDRAYMDLMVSDHEEDIEAFEDAANNLEDAQLKTFASNTVTKLRQHHERAKQVKDMVDKKNR
ncbi:putative membrane protein [Pontibacter aydingkolensis]|uniref:DUF4142 domain-containing protein n=1 Tax=Pontibacter aydingkolensis TaxID=1911536 RepID=A0ABS7CQW1_9BACT|nr:DUF4142 domain-containing protein [Pontibacter aydingkolensis]MBW7466096.1 DUF4142 domain-containing protein [Pontibacter aydingkolensis]